MAFQPDYCQNAVLGVEDVESQLPSSDFFALPKTDSGVCDLTRSLSSSASTSLPANSQQDASITFFGKFGAKKPMSKINQFFKPQKRDADTAFGTDATLPTKTSTGSPNKKKATTSTAATSKPSQRIDQLFQPQKRVVETNNNEEVTIVAESAAKRPAFFVAKKPAEKIVPHLISSVFKSPKETLSPEDDAHFEAVRQRLNVGQQRVMRQILEGHNVSVVGMGGTGKSYASIGAARDHALITCFPASVSSKLLAMYYDAHRCSPQQHGTIIGHMHYIFHIEVTDETPTFKAWRASFQNVRKKHFLKTLIGMMRGIKRILIDEVFANGNGLFSLLSEIVSYLVQEAWREDQVEKPIKLRPKMPLLYKTPFGGKQVIVFGDPNQIVKQKQNRLEGFDHVFTQSPYKDLFPSKRSHVLLTESMRQTNVLLRDITHHISCGDLTIAVDLIKKCRRVTRETVTIEDGPIITHTRKSVKMFNNLMFKKIPGAVFGPYSGKLMVDTATSMLLCNKFNIDVSVINPMYDFHELPQNREILKDVAHVPFDIDAPLLLKEGAKIIFTANVDTAKDWTNGTFAIVVGFTDEGYPIVMRETEHIKRMKAIEKRADKTSSSFGGTGDDNEDFVLYCFETDEKAGHVCAVNPYEYVRHTVRHFSAQGVPYHLCQFKYVYFPIQLGYSFTTSKAQGLDFKRIVACFDDKQYTDNLLTVLCTRSRDEMVVLVDKPDKDFSIVPSRNQETTEFYNSLQ